MQNITSKFFVYNSIFWLITLATLPTILSAPPVNQYLLGWFNHKGAATIEAEDMNFSWLGSQIFKNVSYRDESKSILLTAKEIEIQNSFLKFLMYGEHTFQGKIQGLTVHKGEAAKLEINNLSTDFEFTANIQKGQIPQIKLNQYPGELIGKLLKTPKFQELFGSAFAVTIGFPQGALSKVQSYDITIEGKETLVQAGIAIKDQTLVTRPGSFLQLNWTATPQREQLLREWLLPKANPAELALAAPARLTIRLEDLSVPLKNFNFKTLRIGKSKADFGQMSFKNSGIIAKVLKLLTPASSEEATVWLTPAYFTMSDGTVNLQRVDMLAMNLFPMALWGKIDLPSGDLNMTLGIPLQLFTQEMGMPESIGGQMLQLPLGGTLSKIELDTSISKRKISSLASQLLKKLPKGVSDVVKKIAGTESDEIPAPTTTPFPWEKGSTKGKS